jgi:aspartyl-tRNA(Asn)/glutamyl-tRNA(Gln) amidotransferase subunit C
MSKIGIEEVKRLARLARIGLNDEEVGRISVELDQIVTFVERLNETDTSDVPETNQVTGLSDVWRDDAIEPSQLNQEELLAGAPEQQAGQIKVKRVLE